MTTFLVIGDIHFDSTNKLSRKDVYVETLLRKLTQIKDLSNQYNVDFVLCLGDIFNKKDPYKVAHWLVRRAIGIFSEFNMPIYSIVGNHDITSNSLDSLERQPLSILFASKVIKQLDEEVIGNVRLQGLNYQADYEKMIKEAKFMEKKDNEFRIAITHGNILPDGEKLFDETIVNYSELKNHNFDMLINGHLHWTEIIEKIGDKYFVGLGSVMRDKRDQEDRKPYVLMVGIDKTDKFEVKFKKLPLNIVEKVFYEKVEVDKADTQTAEEFIAQIGKELNEDVKVDVLALVDSVAEKYTYNIEVIARVKKYLEER